MAAAQFSGGYPWLAGRPGVPASSGADVGYTSLVAPWLGGASVPADAGEQVAYTSLLASWLGGASAPSDAEQVAYTSLLAAWMGGASTGEEAPEPEPDEDDDGFWNPRREAARRKAEEALRCRLRLRECDERDLADIIHLFMASLK